MTQPTLINLHANEYSQELHYYPFAVNLDRFVGSCNTLNEVCVPNKTEDLNLSVFSMITEINELKTLTKHISCESKCKFDGRKCSSDQWWITINVDLNVKCKKHHVCEKDYVWNPATCNCENGKYLASIMDNSVTICDEVAESNDEDADAEAKSSNKAKSYEEIKTIPTNFNEKKANCKTQSVYILLTFLLIIIALLIVVSISCYLIKYWAKQLLPFHYRNNELR